MQLRMAFAVPHAGREKAMKASLLIVASLALATLSIAPANAEKQIASTVMATTSGNCSASTWPVMSTEPCAKRYAHSYTECTSALMKMGNDSTSAWWWCTNQGFRN
jgi:hypothetical protein